MDKIRVLHFTIGNVMGGVTQYVLNLWKYIDKEKYQFDFVTMSKELDFAKELTDEGCKVFYLSCYAEDDREQFIKEMRQILDQGYEVIHLHTRWWRSFLVEELATEYRVPKIIVHAHNTEVCIMDPLKREFETRVHMRRRDEISPRLATDFWACSRKAADWLFGKNIPQNIVRIMNNAIDVENFQYDERVRKNIRNELGIENRFVIGHVGRFAYEKNHEFLIRVLAEVLSKKKNVSLLLIGVGNLEDSIHKLAEQFGIEEKVLFLGKRTDVNKLYQAMDLFVLPSKSEGLGLTLIEAQAAGLKCICSDAIPEEARITDNVKMLPLDEKVWSKTILQMSLPYERRDMRKDITDAGYDILSQIKIVEENYKSHIIC